MQARTTAFNQVIEESVVCVSVVGMEVFLPTTFSDREKTCGT